MFSLRMFRPNRGVVVRLCAAALPAAHSPGTNHRAFAHEQPRPGARLGSHPIAVDFKVESDPNRIVRTGTASSPHHQGSSRVITGKVGVAPVWGPACKAVERTVDSFLSVQTVPTPVSPKPTKSPSLTPLLASAAKFVAGLRDAWG